MTNTDPETGIAYGVIAMQSLDNDVGQELWYGPQARDLSYEAALEELKVEVEREADDIEDEVRIGIAESDPSLVGNERWEDRRIEDAYLRCGYDNREDFIEREIEDRQESIQIEEPIIEGTYEGVQYRIDWLGGAPLLWVFKSPHVTLAHPCSPCVPGAGDLDNVEDGYIDTYDVPVEWRRTK